MVPFNTLDIKLPQNRWLHYKTNTILVTFIGTVGRVSSVTVLRFNKNTFLVY